jgi:V8-like Glu-specific endopeptidase
MHLALLSWLILPSHAGVHDLIGDRDYDLPPLESFEGFEGFEDFESLESLDLGLARTPNGPQGIVGGSLTTGHDNVVVLLALDRWGGFMFCSGSQVDDNWVVTAAHCLDGVDDLERDGYDMVVGWGHDVYGSGLDDMRDWSNYYLHPDYDERQLRNDIGLVQFGPSKTGVRPMILNDEPVNNSWGGVELTFVGFGDTYDGANDAGDKRETTIPLYAYDNQFVYSYAPDTNVCQGDSGGAAMEINKDGDYELVGVNSFVSPSCVNGENGAARVDKYIPWI